MEYEFLLVVEGVSIDDDAVVVALTEQFDAQLSWHRGLHRLAVVAEGENPVEAMQTLLPRLASTAPAMTIRWMDADLVGVADIAERTGRTRQNVQQWVDGERNSESPFPPPEGTAGRSLVWRWSDVNNWLVPLGLDDGENRPTRAESVFVDLLLQTWQTNRAHGVPMLKLVVASDERGAERLQVAQRFNQAALDEAFIKSILAWPRQNAHKLVIVCSVLLDPLRFVLEQMGDEVSGMLAVLTGDTELHLTPIAAQLLPGAIPISSLGLSDEATVGDLVLAQRDSGLGSSRPLLLDGHAPA